MPDLILSGLLVVEYISSALLLLIALLIARGFLPIVARPDGSAVWHLAAAVMSLEVGIAARAAYWSAFPIQWRDTIGKAPPNILFGLILIVGGYHMLRLLLLIIPDNDREKYSILTAPFYPRRWRDQLSRALDGLIRRRQ